MARAPFELKVRVRLDETDALGVVYYGQYFAYFDLARLEMLRSLGITMGYLNARRLGFVAAEATCSYRSSAIFDDELSLRVSVARLGKTSVTYSHSIRRKGKPIAEGKVTDVLVGQKGTPVAIPVEMRNLLSRFA